MVLGRPPEPWRAVVVGTGLIGGSIGMRLRRVGWYVTGRDLDPQRAEKALALGALDEVGDDPDATITFVATPVTIRVCTPRDCSCACRSVPWKPLASSRRPRCVRPTVTTSRAMWVESCR